MGEECSVRTSAITAGALRIACNLQVTMEADRVAPDGTCRILFGTPTPTGPEWLSTEDHYVRADGLEAVVPVVPETNEMRAVRIAVTPSFSTR